ncbi:unnamed protein product [Pylaiella littoralis]
MPHVLLIGATGAGKSTLANLLLYDDPEGGFVVGHGEASETSNLKTETATVDDCFLQVTDTPGIPDTNRKKSLRFYDKMIKYLRDDTYHLNAIVIMVAEGRNDERVYRDMRALMKHFNTLPCGKIMVFRSTLPPRCSDNTRKLKDIEAKKTMDKLCREAGLKDITQYMLHDMDDREVKILRNLICQMPDKSKDELQLRTYSQIKQHAKKLSDQQTRMEALRDELNDLSERRTASEASARKYRDAAIGTAFIPFVGAAISAAMTVEMGKAEATVRSISHDMHRMQGELDRGQVDQGELRKAREEFDELDALSRG